MSPARPAVFAPCRAAASHLDLGHSGQQPAVFAFGFRGVAHETLRRHVLAATEVPDSPRVLTGVCVLESGLVLPLNAEGNAAAEDIDNYGVAHAREGAWGILVSVLFAALVMAPHAAPNLLSYIKAGKLLDSS